MFYLQNLNNVNNIILNLNVNVTYVNINNINYKQYIPTNLNKYIYIYINTI